MTPKKTQDLQRLISKLPEIRALSKPNGRSKAAIQSASNAIRSALARAGFDAAKVTFKTPANRKS